MDSRVRLLHVKRLNVVLQGLFVPALTVFGPANVVELHSNLWMASVEKCLPYSEGALVSFQRLLVLAQSGVRPPNEGQ